MLFLLPLNECLEGCGFGSDSSKVCSFCHYSSQVNFLHWNFPLPLPPHMCGEERWKIAFTTSGSPGVYQIKLSASQSLGLTLVCLFAREWPSSMGSRPGVPALVLSTHGSKHYLCSGFQLAVDSGTPEQKAHNLHACWWCALGLMGSSRQRHDLMQCSFSKCITEIKLFPFLIHSLK